MKTAIVILNYNDAPTTLGYLGTIKDYAVFDTIVVVDNHSTDEDTGKLEAYCKEQHLVFLQASNNGGYAAGNNIGARYSVTECGADIVIISNPDIICTEEAVKGILEAFRMEDRIGLATGLVHVKDGNGALRVYSSFAYKVPTLADMFLNCFPLTTKIRRTMLGKSMYYTEAQVRKGKALQVGAVSGCFFAITAKAYKAIGGFDERTFLYYEEPILGHRLRKAGFKSLVTDHLIIHDEKTDKRRGLRRQWATYKRNLASAKIYLKEYLRANRPLVTLFSLCSFIGFMENYVILLLKER